MSEEMIIHCCAPTLAALKTGSVFNCAFKDREELALSLSRIKKCLGSKGVSVVDLRYQDGRGLIYFYRPKMLEKDLANPLARKILDNYGYPMGCISELISHLKRRLEYWSDFPHELGLFLGYPPEDVRGFIEKGECKLIGLWKVYESDAEKAREIFERCRECTNLFLKKNREGWSLSKLTITL